MSHPRVRPASPTIGRPGLVAVLVLLLSVSGAAAQQVAELRDEYVAEAQMLDADIDNYLDAREQERAALSELVALNRELDRALADPSVPSERLGELDREIAQAREIAFSVSQDVGDRRQELAERVERMNEIGERLRSAGLTYVEPNGAVGGSWLIETGYTVGLLSLEQRGARVSGIYRMSTGRHGRVTGSFTGNRLLLEFSDSEFGVVGNLDGVLDARGELEGQWSARELAAGQPTGGVWTARRVSLEDIFEFEP